ncbi:MAG TPA: hypothetical protein VFB80_03010 [Pirellulaceae bacterium]|nr:hypothetical protein [Pirellulaceae bacterium]
MAYRLTIFIILLSGVPALAAPADIEPASASGSAAGDVAALAAQLASPQFRLRQQAFERLLDAGKDALGPVAEVARSPHREARSRALSILAALAAAKNEDLAAAAFQTLRDLESNQDQTIVHEVRAALAEVRVARAYRAIAAIRAGGGMVSSALGDEPTAGSDLRIEIGSVWKGGNAGLKALAELRTTTYLSLEGAPIDDAALAYVGQLESLEYLYLKQTRVRGSGLSQLKLSSLTHLSLRELPIDDAALASLPTLPLLAHLGLDHTQVTDAGLGELARYPQLDTLWLDYAPITDAGLAKLAALPKLRTLCLTGTKATGPGLASLRDLRALHYVSLKEVSLSPDTTRHLAKVEQLEILGLDHTNVNDEQLADLAPLVNLKTLWLSKTPVTDAGIAHLAKLKSLQMVYFHGSQVTAEGRKALRDALPNCRVEPDDDRPGRP